MRVLKLVDINSSYINHNTNAQSLRKTDQPESVPPSIMSQGFSSIIQDFSNNISELEKLTGQLNYINQEIRNRTYKK